MVDIDLDSLVTDPFRNMNVVSGSNILAHDYAVAFSTSCTKRAEQFLCFGPSPADGQPITIGDVHFSPGSKRAFRKRLEDEAKFRANIAGVHGPAEAAKYGADIERHEAVHSGQWAKHLKAETFVAKYFAWEAVRSYWILRANARS
ncbi:hypothetical protein [Streptomyces erythrochromogenes]|uniref:hypothetical protein n=1 Tax=Streptomyces erythrochromogenes TaxID=285574 RepID=UPI0033FF99CB